MWRRNHIPEPQMGYQAYPEPQMDERYLETIPEVESLYSRRSSVAATALPELPFRPVPPMNDCESVYSDDGASPIVSNFDSRQEPARPHPVSTSQENVSPISPQDDSHLNGSDTSLVSPIEPSAPAMTPPAAGQPHSSASQIPRRLPVAPAQPSPNSNEEIPRRWALRDKRSEETRWDEYSGEPNRAGKPSSVRPGEAPSLLQQYPQLKERTRQILAGLKEREAAGKSSWGKVPPPVATDPMDNPVQRPPWKGASGRHAIVEPVKNTPHARTRPLMLVERQKQTQQEPRSRTPEEPKPQDNNPRSPIDAVSVAASTLPTVRSVPSEESIKPVAPLKGRNTPRMFSPTQAEHPRSLDSPFQSPGPAPPNYDTAPSPTPSTIHDYGGDSPTLGSTASLNEGRRSSSEESLDETLKPKLFQREPDTTSTWNTYATSTVEEDTPIPESPIAREQYNSSPTPMTTRSATDPPPIVLRKRVAANNSGYASYDSYGGISPFSNISSRKSSSSILRKAVGSGEKPRAVSLMSSLSIGKSLPPTPGELEAADKAASLQARLEDLARRKRNLNKIIVERRESLRKNAIVYDSRKRKEVEKMIVNFTQEIQEVTNEEHEVSLKLHRVHKRRDKDDFYEQPTGLWIKRVTT